VVVVEPTQVQVDLVELVVVEMDQHRLAAELQEHQELGAVAAVLLQ